MNAKIVPSHQEIPSSDEGEIPPPLLPPVSFLLHSTQSPPSEQATVNQHTWRRGNYVATDVLPRNAIITEADNRLRAIDFIVTEIG